MADKGWFKRSVKRAEEDVAQLPDWLRTHAEADYLPAVTIPGKMLLELRSRVAALEAETQQLQARWGKDYHELAEDYKKLEADQARPEAENARLRDAAEMLWVVLSNVSGGDWTQQTPEWQEAAARWRDNYFAAIAVDGPQEPS